MDKTVEVFDLYRIFIGNQPPAYLLEILFRTIVIYLFTILMVKFLGKRGRSSLTPVEYIITFALGSAVGDPMFYPEIPLTWSFAVITAFVLTQKLISNLTNNFKFFQNYVQSKPVKVIHRGKFIKNHIEDSGFDKDQIFSMLRQAGHENTMNIKLAFLEPSGRLSIITDKNEKYLENAESTLPDI